MKDQFDPLNISIQVQNQFTPVITIKSSLYHKYTVINETEHIQKYLNGKAYIILMKLKEKKYQNDCCQYLNRFYHPDEVNDKINILAQFYKYHKDFPYLFNRPEVKIMLFYKKKMRNYNYKFIKQLLKEQNGMSITTLKSSQDMQHLYSSSFIPKSKYSSILSALDRDTTEQTNLLEDLCSNQAIKPPSAIHPKQNIFDESYVIELHDLIKSQNQPIAQQGRIVQTNLSEPQKNFMKKTKAEQIALHFAKQALNKLSKKEHKLERLNTLRKKSKSFAKAFDKDKISSNGIILTARSKVPKLLSLTEGRPKTDRKNCQNIQKVTNFKKPKLKTIQLKTKNNRENNSNLQPSISKRKVYSKREESNDKKFKLSSNKQNRDNVNAEIKKYSKYPQSIVKHRSLTNNQFKCSLNKKNNDNHKQEIMQKHNTKVLPSVSISISKINTLFQNKLRY